MKARFSEIKNTLARISDSIDVSEEKIIDLEDIAIQTIQMKHTR